MTDDSLIRTWNAALHPRAPKGSPAGGQFSSGNTSAAPTRERPVGQGARGQQVKDLQRRLNELGANLKDDGVFGPKTLEAVREFQRTHTDQNGNPLKVDGLVGPLTTWALRHEAQSKAKAPSAHQKHLAHVAHEKHQAAAAAAAKNAPRAPQHSAPAPTAQPAKHRGGRVMARTAQTAEASTVHKPFGKPGGPGLWGTGKQLPAYIQSVAHHLVTQGHDVSHAIGEAVGIVKNWAHGHDGHGNPVHPDVQAAAAKAIAEWEKLRAEAHSDNRPGVRRAAVSLTRAQMTTQDINDLPDSDFAYIEPGGSKDSSGKTVPRSLRHFPVHDAAHIRNALARLPQSNLSAEQKAAAMRKIRARAEKAGVEVGGGDNSGGGMSRAELFRSVPLEDYHIVRTGEGDSSGRVVEAYMTVFGEPTEIHDRYGDYEEDIDRAAFNKRIADLERSRNGFAAAKVFYNHGMTIHGSPSDRYSMPVAVCEGIRADTRGPVTRSRYLDTPLGNEVLEMWRSGAITAQSFTGAIIRSSPELRPGEKYRPRGGRLPRVRRLELGLKEYGPTPFPAYQGAELVGVRMAPLGTWQGADEDEELYDEDVALLPDGEAAAGGPPELHPTREHAHRLWQMRTEELCRQAGITLQEN